jgi:hypothetical protein
MVERYRRRIVDGFTRECLANRNLARRLQHPASARLTRPSHPEGIRRYLEGGLPPSYIVIPRSQLDQNLGSIARAATH